MSLLIIVNVKSIFVSHFEKVNYYYAGKSQSLMRLGIYVFHDTT